MSASSPGDLSPLQSPECKRGSSCHYASPGNKRRRCDVSPISASTRPTTADSEANTDLVPLEVQPPPTNSYNYQQQQYPCPWSTTTAVTAPPPPPPWLDPLFSQTCWPPHPSRTMFLQQQQQRKHQRTREAFQATQHHLVMPKRKGRQASQGTYAQQARAACRISPTGPMLPANGPLVARCVQPRSDAERHAKLMRQSRPWPEVSTQQSDEASFCSLWPPNPNAPAPQFDNGCGYHEPGVFPPRANDPAGTKNGTGVGTDGMLDPSNPVSEDNCRLPRCANARAAISAYPYPPAPPHRLPKLKHSRQQFLFQEYLKVVQDPMRIQLGHFLIEHCIRSVPDDCIKPDAQPDPTVIVEFADQIIAAVQIFGHETRFGTAQDSIPSDINEAYIYNWIHQNRTLLQPLEAMLDKYRRNSTAGGFESQGEDNIGITRRSSHHEDKGSRRRRPNGHDTIDCLEKQDVPGAIHCENLPAVIAHAGLLVRLPHQSYAVCNGGCSRCTAKQQRRQHLLFNLLIAGRGDTRRCRMQMPWGDTVYIKYNRTLLGIPDFVVSGLGFGTGASGGTQLIPKVCAVSLEEVPAGVEILLFYRGLPCVKRKLQSVPRFLAPGVAYSSEKEWRHSPVPPMHEPAPDSTTTENHVRFLANDAQCAPTTSYRTLSCAEEAAAAAAVYQDPLLLCQPILLPGSVSALTTGFRGSVVDPWLQESARHSSSFPECFPPYTATDPASPEIEEQDVGGLPQSAEANGNEQMLLLRFAEETLLKSVPSEISQGTPSPSLEGSCCYSVVNSPDSFGVTTDASPRTVNVEQMWAVHVPPP